MSSAASPLPSRPDDHARVLIVDDSAVARAMIARMVDTSDHFVVTRTVASVAVALAFLTTETVEIILLDVNMPGVDGLTALPDLIEAGRGAKVIVVSSSAGDGAATTIQALALGAADTLVKPSVGGMSARFAEALAEKLDRLASPAPVVAPVMAPPPAPRRPVQVKVAAALSAEQPPKTSIRASEDEYDIVAIGASTGGIHALGQLLRALPPHFRLPIIVTQHLPASFMPYFAAQLAVLAGRPCDVATDRMRVRPGRVVVAPGDAHLRCVSLGEGAAALRLTTEAATSGCMPSVDPMLTSMAEVYGPRMLAIMLSGMGRDGADGARAVHDAGGCVVIQDQTSSVVWGMPGAVAAQGIADAILPPDAIGRLAAARRRP